ncbi:MAG: FAD binding domain-containing protein [Anaerolineaceae bacterium]|nr:FAD binding domain-containing protein [Anaerolineaceae bacterium]
MWQKYFIVNNVRELTDILTKETTNTRIIAGGTDLMLELERGLRPEIQNLVDISRVPGLDKIWECEQEYIHIGPMVTHNDIVASKLIRKKGFPLFQACWQVGSPQIRNRGTVAGNLVTGSPANDTITPLIGLNAILTLSSSSGNRELPLSEFYLGVRKTVLRSDEYLSEIKFKGLLQNQRGLYIKSALRRAQAISVVNACVILSLDGNYVKEASITMGAVAPTIIHASKAENYLINKDLSDEVIEQVSKLAGESAKPISDIRGSGNYRSYTIMVIIHNALISLRSDKYKESFPDEPILLSVPAKGNASTDKEWNNREIVTTINNKVYSFESGLNKNLLWLIREKAGLSGTKEGCGEGECGACTIHMDGKAVMSCLVPAPRAHGAQITTIEGVQEGDNLHPLQQAFIDYGAVQCGFCTPGFVMSGVKLLEEKENPTQDDVKQAITGNLCRCTGYYKIVQAIEAASISSVNSVEKPSEVELK